MKYLLNGVAIAAALAIAAPAWAQNAAPAKMAPAPAAMAPAPAAQGGAMPMASKQMHKRRPMRMARHKRGGHMAAGADAATEQLNRDELARLQGGAPPPAGAPMNAPQGGPRASGH
jgi:hypothetical protein